MEEDSVIVRIAAKADVRYIYQIMEAMKISAQQRGAGISPPLQKSRRKMYEGKAVVAVTHETGEWVGFAYLEAWSQNAFVSNGGLIVNPGFRGKGEPPGSRK